MQVLIHCSATDRKFLKAVWSGTRPFGTTFYMIYYEWTFWDYSQSISYTFVDCYMFPGCQTVYNSQSLCAKTLTIVSGINWCVTAELHGCQVGLAMLFVQCLTRSTKWQGIDSIIHLCVLTSSTVGLWGHFVNGPGTHSCTFISINVRCGFGNCAFLAWERVKCGHLSLDVRVPCQM